MRLQAVRAARDGIAVETIAKTLGLNKRTVFRWLAEYAKGGQKALLAKPIPVVRRS